jgi:flagellum-specific ATP synthase
VCCLRNRPRSIRSKRPIEQALDVGVRCINGLLTLGRGQRVGLFAGSGVGKSVLLGMITRQTEADVIVVGLIGERGREVREFIEHSLGPEGMRRAIVVVAPADEPALMRMMAAELCHTIAAHFRDQGLNVLLLLDSLTRYAMARREIALALGEPPATRGYPPSVFSMLPQLVESAGNGERGEGSMTAIYTVLAEGDDQQDPVADTARAILDGHIVLRRELAERGHYPAIDVGASISRCMPLVVSEAHLQAARQVKELQARYAQVRELIPMGAYVPGADARTDQAVQRWPQLEAFLRQGTAEAAPFAACVAQLGEVLA